MPIHADRCRPFLNSAGSMTRALSAGDHRPDRRRRLGLRTDLAGCGDEFASAGDLLSAREAAIGEPAVVPDAMEALGQHMHEEPANELVGLERHGLVSIGTLDSLIFVFEGHTLRIGRSSECWK